MTEQNEQVSCVTLQEIIHPLNSGVLPSNLDPLSLSLVVEGSYRGLIIYIHTKAKCRHLKKITYKGTLRHGVSQIL